MKIIIETQRKVYNDENPFSEPALEVHEVLNDDEVKWLLALSILEISFHGH